MKSSLNKVLYLSRDGLSYSHVGKLAGILRYCSSRGWVAESVIRQGFSAEICPAYCDGTDYTHDVSASAAKVKLTWCKRNPFVITVR